MLELLMYVPLAWFLVSTMGITGGAMAWTLRIGLDCLLPFGVSWKLYNMSPRVFTENGLLRGVMVLSVLTAMLLIILSLNWATIFQTSVVTVLMVLFALTSWQYVLDIKDKEFISSAVRRISNVVRG